MQLCDHVLYISILNPYDKDKATGIHAENAMAGSSLFSITISLHLLFAKMPRSDQLLFLLE